MHDIFMKDIKKMMDPVHMTTVELNPLVFLLLLTFHMSPLSLPLPYSLG
jgi:hypothetical protein